MRRQDHNVSKQIRYLYWRTAIQRIHHKIMSYVWEHRCINGTAPSYLNPYETNDIDVTSAVVKGIRTLSKHMSLQWNSALHHIPCSYHICCDPNSTYQLQRLQNAAARIVWRVRRQDHISPTLILESFWNESWDYSSLRALYINFWVHSLMDLHWLPVIRRIDHKIISITFGCLNGNAPSYLQELIYKHEPSTELRSSSQALLKSPA